MFIKNFSVLKSQVIVCSEVLGKYIISRNIPLLSVNNNAYVFTRTDLLDEIIQMLPEEYGKEVYEYK